MKKYQMMQSKQTLVKSNFLLDKVKSLETSINNLGADLKNKQNTNMSLEIKNKKLLKIKTCLLKKLKDKNVIHVNFVGTANKKIQKMEIKANQVSIRLKYVEHLNEEFLKIMDGQEKKLEDLSEQRVWLTHRLVETVKENILQDDSLTVDAGP